MNSLNEIIGSSYKKTYLKKLQSRIRNRLKPVRMRQPTVFLIETAGKRRYKLLQVTDSKNVHFNLIKENSIWFEKLDFVPEILWADEKRILIDFIEGNYPDVSQIEFARAYAKNLAIVHQLDRKMVEYDEYMADVFDDIGFLVKQDVVKPELQYRIIHYINQLAPSQIEIGLSYTDQNIGNFVIDDKEKLYFIDLGSFQTETAIDEFVAAGDLLQKIDQNEFKETYLNSGGTDFLFKYWEFLFVVNQIRRSVFNFERYLEVPFFDYRLKRARKRNYLRSINYMAEYISRHTNKAKSI